MPIYYGKSADGSDAKEFQGMYVSPCGKFWSNMPFASERKQGRKVWDFKRKRKF